MNPYFLILDCLVELVEPCMDCKCWCPQWDPGKMLSLQVTKAAAYKG